MTGLGASRVPALRSAAERVRLAPSIHNTQPWRLVLYPDQLEVHADRDRQLAVLDPNGRHLHLSLGCAVFNARVGLATQNVPVRVDYLPDAQRPDLVATLVADPDHGAPEPELAALDPAIDRRHTNRRQFAEPAVREEDERRLVRVAELEDASLTPVSRDEDRQTLARLSQKADDALIVDPRYRAELRAWTSDDPNRTDGVPAAAVPHVDGSSGDEVPIRDFDTRGAGWLPSHTGSTAHQCLLVLGTRADSRLAWLRAGEALQRVWLELTHLGYVASVFTQVVEVPALRARLRQEIRLDVFPHLVMRVGRAPETPASMRRPLGQILDDRSRSG